MSDAGQLARGVAGFAGALRRAGLVVPVGSVLLMAESFAAVGIEDPDRVYWAGRAAVVHRPDEEAAYNRAFTAWFGGSAWQERVPVSQPLRVALDDDSEEEADKGQPGEASPDLRWVRYSAAEVLRRRDIAALSPEEWDEAKRIISAFRLSADVRATRRTRPSTRGSRPDLRRTFKRSVRYGGLPIERSWRAAAERPRRLVFLLDVSGSMEPYSRALARFAQAAVASRRSGGVEVLTVGTRLTRITREMSGRDPDAALDAVAAAVADWAGGTRLGDSIGRFNDVWGVRGLARGSVVVICSDGWDRGSPEVMAAEMGRLARVARRVVWVNPLKASPGYAPLARGMAAALPYVDDFVDGHSVDSLEQLARRLSCASGRYREVPR